MKKIISILLMLALLACFTPAVLAASLGDIDADNAVTAGDARLALRAAVGLETLTAAQKARADADADGSVTAADARLILRVAVDLSEISSDGKRIVDKLTAADKLRNWVIENGQTNDYGQYGYSVTYDLDGITVEAVYFYLPGDETPLGVAVYCENEGYLFETQVYFNTSFSDYYVAYMVFDESDEQVVGVEYSLAYASFSYDTAGASLTKVRGAGDEDDPAMYREDAGNWAFVGLRLLLQEMADAGVDVNYSSDMHLYHIYD